MAKKAYVTPDAGATWVQVASETTDLSAYVEKTGDTMTGNLTVNARIVADHLPFAMAANTLTMSISAAANTNASVTFPSGRFTAAPVVTAVMANAPGGSAKLVARAINSTSTGTSIYVYTGDSTTTTSSNFEIDWIAVQMTSSTGGG